METLNKFKMDDQKQSNSENHFMFWGFDEAAEQVYEEESRSSFITTTPDKESMENIKDDFDEPLSYQNISSTQ